MQAVGSTSRKSPDVSSLACSKSKYNFFSVTPFAVGDRCQDIGSGGDVEAVAVSGGVRAEIVLRARLSGVAGEVATGIEIESVGGGHTVLNQCEVNGLAVALGRLIFFE